MLDNKKGLTLIELLGVIVIIGIIATIAFFSITRIIENTRKDAFATNVNTFAEAARLDAETVRVNNLSATVFEYFIDVIDKENNTYVIKRKIGDDTDDKAEEVNLEFSRDLEFKAGRIKIEFRDGTVKITIEEDFQDANYQTNAEGKEIPISRDDVIDYNADSTTR